MKQLIKTAAFCLMAIPGISNAGSIYNCTLTDYVEGVDPVVTNFAIDLSRDGATKKSGQSVVSYTRDAHNTVFLSISPLSDNTVFADTNSENLPQRLSLSYTLHTIAGSVNCLR